MIDLSSVGNDLVVYVFSGFVMGLVLGSIYKLIAYVVG